MKNSSRRSLSAPSTRRAPAQKPATISSSSPAPFSPALIGLCGIVIGMCFVTIAYAFVRESSMPQARTELSTNTSAIAR